MEVFQAIIKKNVLWEFYMMCDRCNGTGEIKIPEYEKIFDQEFDRLDKIGSFSPVECEERALDRSGYTIEKCPKCNGTGVS